MAASSLYDTARLDRTYDGRAYVTMSGFTVEAQFHKGGSVTLAPGHDLPPGMRERFMEAIMRHWPDTRAFVDPTPQDATLRRLVDHCCRYPCDDTSWAYLHDHITEIGHKPLTTYCGHMMRVSKAKSDRKDWIGELKAMRVTLLANVEYWEIPPARVIQLTPTRRVYVRPDTVELPADSVEINERGMVCHKTTHPSPGSAPSPESPVAADNAGTPGIA